MLTGQDFGEIERLYGLYNQGSDFRDAEMFLSAFSEDAVITSGGVETRGMAALRKVREERYQGQTGDNGRRHLKTNPKDTAGMRGSCTCTTSAPSTAARAV